MSELGAARCLFILFSFDNKFIKSSLQGNVASHKSSTQELLVDEGTEVLSVDGYSMDPSSMLL